MLDSDEILKSVIAGMSAGNKDEVITSAISCLDAMTNMTKWLAVVPDDLFGKAMDNRLDVQKMASMQHVVILISEGGITGTLPEPCQKSLVSFGDLIYSYGLYQGYLLAKKVQERGQEQSEKGG